MQGLRYTSRGLRRCNNTDKWEVTLSHVDPITGETARTFHTVGAKTKKGAEKARDALIFGLGSDGGAVGSSMTVREFMEQSLRYKEASGTIEPSTVRSYRGEAKQLYPALGAIRLAELTSADIDRWMAGMTAEGYAPKTVAKPFKLLKQALKWAVGQDLLTKNACDFCKPPKRAKTPINALSREDRSRMLALAREAIGQPLGLAIELALTTGMRRGEVCALRWSDLNDDGSVTVSHALGNGEGGFYLKEPKTGSSARTIPPHEEHLRETAGMAQGGAPAGPRVRLRPRRRVHPGHLGARQPPIQPHDARQGLRRRLQDERLLLHVPRPAPHLRHHDDRQRLRREDGGELPGARERLDDARHLRRRGPGREGGGGVEGGGQLRFGRVRARPHPRRGTRPAPEGAQARHFVHGRAARGHARRRQGQGGRP